MARSLKHRLTRPLERYVINPVMRTACRTNVAPSAFALVATTGRRTGRHRVTPVGNGLEADVFWLVAEHGQQCDYVKNLVANPQVEVKARRQWRRGTARIVPGDDAAARRRRLDKANGRSAGSMGGSSGPPPPTRSPFGSTSNRQVSDQEAAKRFLVDQRGFELIAEATLGDDMPWIQVGPEADKPCSPS
jgi:deazaflavin-dependent oxidoreductase (nitroreductase family)